MSKYENQPPEAAAVQGLTQMYYLEEKDEEEQLAVSDGGEAASAALANRGYSYVSVAGAGDAAGAGVATSLQQEWPVGLSQMIFLEDAHEEAEVAARALPSVSRSFLRERLGVSGEVVQDLRQVWDKWISVGPVGLLRSCN